MWKAVNRACGPRQVLLFLLMLFAAQVQAQCNLPGGYNYNPGFRADSPAVGMLGDYGLVFDDAKKRECSIGFIAADQVKHGAYEALIKKINATFSYNNPTNDPTGGLHRDHFGLTDPSRPSVKPFQGAFEGGHVALIFAAALMIGGHGDLDTQMDNALIRVRNSYNYTKNPNCGFYQPKGWNNGGDTCMEEHALAATGYAWIAAYEMKRRGPASADPYALKASKLIDDALSTYDSICLNDPAVATNAATRGPCNIDTNNATILYDELVQDGVSHMTRAYPLSFNREQNMTYGIGQLTIISAALVGLEEAASRKTLTTSQQIIAAALLEEGQRKADPNGYYFNGGAGSPGNPTCAHASIVNGQVVRDDDRNCSEGAVRPRIWNLTSKRATQGYSSFFEQYVQAYPPRTTVVDRRFVNEAPPSSPTDSVIYNAYKFDQYTNYFTKDANNGDLNWGRESFYHVLGFRWHTLDPNRNANAGWVAAGDNKRPRLWAYLDNFNPGGYLDGIDVNGVARGWTCDADRPWEAIPVDFYVNGQQTFVLKAWANQPSEAAVNNLCGGGTAHRFVVQMPAWTKGQPISAWGLDSTWRGFTQLAGYACAQNPSCVW